MADFLTAVSTTAIKRSAAPEARLEKRQPETVNMESPEEISKILKNEPDIRKVEKILRHLAACSSKKDGFNLVTPGPVSAQIVDTFVVNIIPDFWKILKDSKMSSKDLVKCLQNANGL